MNRANSPLPPSSSETTAGHALLIGALAGLCVALLGLGIGVFMPKGIWSVMAPSLGALLAGAVASGITAYLLGRALGNSIAIAFLTLFLLAFISFLLEYGLLVNLAMSPYLVGADESAPPTISLDAKLRDVSLLVSLINIALGGVFGLLFGRSRTSPTKY